MTQAWQDDATAAETGPAWVLGADGRFFETALSPVDRCLPRLSEETAAGYRHWFGTERRPTTAQDDQPAEWTFFYPRRDAAENACWVELDTGTGPFWLRLDEGHHRAMLGDRPWHRYEGENRLLAWALAHEPFLRHLSVLLNDACTPRGFADQAPAAPDEDRLVCGWRFAGPGFDLAGCVHWTPAQAATFGAAIDRATTAPPVRTNRPRWPSLPIPCRLTLRGHRYGRDEIAEFETGDCLLVAGTFRTGLGIRLQPMRSSHFWQADIKTGQLIVTQGPETPQNPVGDEPTTTEPTSTPLDVDISFELGDLTLPLRTLEQLQAGVVLSLPDHLDQTRVRVRANGTAIGEGRLVAIGDQLGVQLTDIAGDGV